MIKLRPKYSVLKDKVYMVDIENTLFFAFNHEISLYSMLTGKPLLALKDFVRVLVKYLPTRPLVHNYLTKIDEFLNKFTIKSELSHILYSSKLESLESELSYLPLPRPWKGCLGSESKYRGYTCGLWTLFHTLTVNAFLRRRMDKDYDPHETLRAIHGYVKYFFGCTECSNHFQQMYAIDAEKSVIKPKDEIFWLWHAHNKVNKRLSGDITEDPEHPKQLFPPHHACPSCWTDKDGEMSLDKEESVKFIIEMYSIENFAMDGVLFSDFLFFLSSFNIFYLIIYSISTFVVVFVFACVFRKYRKYICSLLFRNTFFLQM